ncbi:hypothetical protein [Streptomyces sp. NPDC058623]|uniref:hypothetical protein n=1 Tax=Streptomyces sp. NPDC058623 TaxID=3346563 RepID=UPI00364DD1B3
MIIIIALTSALAGFGSLISLAMHSATAVRLRSAAPLLHAWVFTQVAVAALFCAGLAFVSGHMTGFNPPDPWAVCNSQVSRMFRDPSTPESRLATRSVLPVSVVCEKYPGDPDATEQVPSWVNAAVFAGGGLGLGSAATAPFAGVLRRRLCRPEPAAT